MRELQIAYGRSCRAKTWTNSTTTWTKLTDKLTETVRTGETVSEYAAMEKAAREAAKDHGGFVGGQLRDGRRKTDHVVCRSMLTLDADHAEAGFIERFLKENRCAACIYTTHSHTPEAPRCRLIVPLTRDVTPDEYAAVARYFAEEWNIDIFDECSFRVNQLMYWPSTPSDGEFICEETHGEWLDPDVYLSAHPDWQDCSTLPVSAREKPAKGKPGNEKSGSGKHMEDPLTKVGTVGDFCRTYSISGAIAKFLPEIYDSTEQDDRYDYIAGEGRCGVVVYDNKFAYSHHATDPAGGRLLNAFDLVRIHKFGDEDEKLSYKNMCELALQDDAVQKLIREQKHSEASKDFSPGDPSWEEPLIPDNGALPEFPVDSLPPVLRRYASAVAESTQTAVDMAAVGLLCAVSAAMRNNYKVEGKKDWLEPTNIYGLIIAEPSERKSAVISMITRPVNEYVKEYNSEHRLQIEASRATKRRLENRKNALINASGKKGTEAAADFDDKLQDVLKELINFEEQKPLKVYVDDTTPEKLVETLAENDNAISIISSEGGIFDILSGAYSSKVNIDVFLKAYSGEDISVDRIMRNSVHIDEACLTILLSVQPVVIGNLMKNENFRQRGLTARFLYTHPKSLVGDRVFHSASVSDDIYKDYRGLIFNILSENRGKSAAVIQLTGEAKTVLEEFYNWVEKRLVDEFSMYSDWIGKLVGNTLRIAGILARSAVLKKDTGDAFFEVEEDGPVTITADIMRNAIRIGKYFFIHAVRAYSTMGVYSDYRAILKTVERIIEKDLHTVCRRDLMRYCRWISSADEAQHIMDGLEDYGYVRLIAVDTADKLRGGRPKNPTFAVNPRIFG